MRATKGHFPPFQWVSILWLQWFWLKYIHKGFCTLPQPEWTSMGDVHLKMFWHVLYLLVFTILVILDVYDCRNNFNCPMIKRISFFFIHLQNFISKRGVWTSLDKFGRVWMSLDESMVVLFYPDISNFTFWNVKI